MDNATYERNERTRFSRKMQNIAAQSLVDRMIAKADFCELLRDTIRTHEFSGWVLDGNYGFGEMLAAQDAIKGRGNKIARLGQILAAVECQCPQREAMSAWNSLTPDEQAAANAAIERAIISFQTAQE